MQDVFVYVEFEPAQDRQGNVVQNELGRPVSFEPAKWNAIIHGRVRHQDFDADPLVSELRPNLILCWVAGSDYPTSLNLIIRMTGHHREFSDIKTLFMRYLLGCLDIGISKEPMIIDNPTGKRILPFARTAA